MSSKKTIFFAEAVKGYVIKVIIETLCSGGIGRGIFVITKDGIRLRQSDQGSTILYDVNLPRENFRSYKSTSPLTISVNLKHMKELLKNIKKKDSLSMHIDSTQKGKFFITIRPEGVRENTRFETNSIAYIDEKSYTLVDLPEAYNYPMVINAPDFQKIKRLTSIDKQILITIQGSNYLSFKCDAGVVMDAELGFGNLMEVDTSEDGAKGKCDECDKIRSKCWCTCEDCGEYKWTECWCECPGGCGKYRSECNGGCNETAIFKASYYSAILNKLVKLPGLCAQMQFYSPTIEGYPLKIEVNAGQSGYTLGKVQVYVKDVAQLNYEASLENDGGEAILVTKGKSKKK